MFHRVRTSSLPHLTEATGYNLIKDTFLPRREERDKGKERERERERENVYGAYKVAVWLFCTFCHDNLVVMGGGSSKKLSPGEQSMCESRDTFMLDAGGVLW